jgi:predicted NACHT family NTPase
MVKRSLRASLPGIQQAKQAFASRGWTQENLAEEVGLKTRQSIWRFFTGQPIDRQIFLEICTILEINWREIAIDPPADIAEPKGTIVAAVVDIDTLVRQVRSLRQDKIQNQCGTLQLLNMNRPVRITDLYIEVNVLEEIPSQQWLELADLQNLTTKEFDRFGFGELSQNPISGIKAVEIYSKLRVLGQPGSGKTTFLQYLATQCNRGSFVPNRVPIFVTLRDFADESTAADDFNLLDYLREDFSASGISDLSVIETLLREGRILLLLDGLDEMSHVECRAVVREIRRLSEKYPKNLFVVTCRTAAPPFNLGRFTAVETAAFTHDQIAAFAQKWFIALTKTGIQERREKAAQFIEKLNLPENASLRSLTVTPLFLHLACWIFHHQGKFPTKRSEFYRQCLDLLLSQWDETKGVERDETYQKFSLSQKLKLLSYVAATTFEQNEFLFEQHAIEQHISDYLRDLPNASIDPEELQVESAGILKAIELQHGLLTERVRGIFSFSYAAFQEYFTARMIVATHNLQASNQTLEQLVNHLSNPRWREVFLLTAVMLRSADALVQLMKQRIDAIVAHDPYLQTFLTWAHEQSLAFHLDPTDTLTFYIRLTRTPHLRQQASPAPFNPTDPFEQKAILDKLYHLVLECAANSKFNSAQIHACARALSSAIAMVPNSELYDVLQQLQAELPNRKQRREKLQEWWQTNYADWLLQLKAAVSQYRNTQSEWHFRPEQQNRLQQYYDANQLLLDCLNSNCDISPTVRQELETTFLLPQSQIIEEREWEIEDREGEMGNGGNGYRLSG